ncbi:glutamate racemase [Leptothrix discophora]|uniref:Glutamate racemase n=1 Tax=Leptothrix discophora TaxID=89 RepID=A0ABT9FYE3_LEPDI|nr:glutamate racemase [Leptothrix discophora]MDP4299251.1 glutamate racemase [Leptothrix discophora]
MNNDRADTRMNPQTATAPRIGVFDSGLGGLSVLRSLCRLRDDARFVYVADSGHAPYGDKPVDFIVARSLRVADFLVDQGVDMLVVACNTATAAAVKALRAAHPELPIVGVEPGIKPATQRTRNGRIGVLATEATLRSERFQLLAQAHADRIDLTLQPGVGLAAAIENHALDSATVRGCVERCCAPLRLAGVDTVVLGCTHYPLVADLIASQFGEDVALVDTSEAIARRTLDLRPLGQALGTGVDTRLQLWSSGDPALLTAASQRWLGTSCLAQPLPGPWNRVDGA